MKTTFHHGCLKSPRVSKVLTALRQRPMTTMELAQACNSTRPASDVSELRANGIPVSSLYIGMENGRKIYRYALVSLELPSQKEVDSYV